MAATDKPSQQQSSPSHGGFTTGYSKNVQDRYAARTVANSGTYLLPYLDRLNSSNPGSSNNTPGRPAFTFLDVGCGPGSITVDFAQRYPQAFFVGVDPGITFVEAARARAADLGVENVVFTQGDVAGLAEAVSKLPADILEGKLGQTRNRDSQTSDSPKFLFDVVSCHQVISHLPPDARPGAVNHMHAMAKKSQSTETTTSSSDGIVAIREAEVETLMSIAPSTPALRAWHDLFLGVLEENHGITDDRVAATVPYPHGRNSAGRHLVRIALDSGCFPSRSQIRVGGSLNTHAERDERQAWVESVVPMMENVEGDWYARAMRRLLRDGYKDDRDGAAKALRDMVDAWKKWEEDDTAWLGIGSCEIVCQC